MVKLSKSRAYLSLPAKAKPPIPTVIVIHEWWGLNGHIKHWADRLAADGDAALAVEGTIKDYAGDGVLILIGAPVAMDDHADRALKLARHIRHSVSQVLANWSSDAYPLGLGVGVASGATTIVMRRPSIEGARSILQTSCSSATMSWRIR